MLKVQSDQRVTESSHCKGQNNSFHINYFEISKHRTSREHCGLCGWQGVLNCRNWSTNPNTALDLWFPAQSCTWHTQYFRVTGFLLSIVLVHPYSTSKTTVWNMLMSDYIPYKKLLSLYVLLFLGHRVILPSTVLYDQVLAIAAFPIIKS